MAEREFALVLHDIAPETWPDYADFVAEVDRLGRIPISWLVVPDFHHRSNTFEDAELLALLDRRREQGDELILHGFYHCDDGAAPRTPRDWFMRRFYTVEGEFYAIGHDEAQSRLAHGEALFAERGWPLHGFVAPAWLLSAGARAALKRRGFAYTSDPGHLYTLPEDRPIAAPSLVWSARSGWRRGASWLVNERARKRHRHQPLLRLGLHPVDMRHKMSRRWWLETLRHLLDEGYRPTTKIDWLQRRGVVPNSDMTA
ncbi:DUF2334 domain-containing protein [Kushneria aurantia]|uniref:DUF2334 domain-containing protein n=1 Tax=Kushneria aurantia TaxID=504092 RepID=A0ABV6G2W4_9GAMM|nr:polysaccharide deacetylase family protein [Kushneria aurantia]